MKKFKKSICLILILIILCTLGITSYATDTTNTLDSSLLTNSVKESFPETYSPTILLMETKTGKAIYEKNAYTKMYPASTTKIMTAILALENCPDLSEKATASYEAVFTVPWDYTNANIQVGEELTINHLINVLMIASANEAANILAEHIAGSVSSFASMMNTKAEEIGCKNTHFVNANGMHNENHYTTAYDLALIGRYAMQNKKFREIVSTTVYTLPATNKYDKNDRVFKNTNELIQKDDSDRVDNYYYEYANGIKTGYTSVARSCLVASAKKDDIEYICVILGSDTTENGLAARYLDCKNLFDYAFNNYSVKTLHEANSVLKTIKVPKASFISNNLEVVIEDEISVVVNNATDISSLTPTVEINSGLQAPIAKNSIIGKVTYTVDGNEYSSNLIAARDVADGDLFNKILTIAAIIFVIYLLYKLLNSGNKKTKKRKKKPVKQDKNYLYW